MKQLSISILLVALSILCYGQKSKNTINQEAHNKAQSQANASLDLSLMGLLPQWDLYVMGDKSRAMNNIDAINYFDAYIYGKDSSDEKELIFMRRNKNKLDTLLEDFEYIGSSRSLFASNKMPFTILRTDTGKVFFLESVFTDDIYNTLKLSSRQRAAKVVSNCLSKELQRMNEIMNEKSIKYLAIGAVYGSKNLLNDDDPSNLKPEYVYIISSRTLISKYSLGTISEDEFINSSSIFLSDRDNFGHYKRIKLSIE